MDRRITRPDDLSRLKKGQRAQTMQETPAWTRGDIREYYGPYTIYQDQASLPNQKPPSRLAIERPEEIQPKPEKGTISTPNRNTVVGGGLGFGLFSSNAEQLASLLKMDEWKSYQSVKFALVVFSMILQIMVMVLLVFIEQDGRKKTRNMKMNLLIMVSTLLITVCNVTIASFGSIDR